MKRTTLSGKNVAEELDGIDIDDIGNLIGGNKRHSSMKNVWIVKYSLVMKSLLEKLRKRKKPGVLQTYRCPLYDFYLWALTKKLEREEIFSGTDEKKLLWFNYY